MIREGLNLRASLCLSLFHVDVQSSKAAVGVLVIYDNFALLLCLFRPFPILHCLCVFQL